MENSIVNWLEETARKFPDRKAFVDDKKSYTWGEVRRKSLAIAHCIEEAIPGGKKPVAVYMEKSADMLVAFMGIAYSGNFYSPIAVNMPTSRIDKIVQTLRPALFVTTKPLRDNIGTDKIIGYEGNILCFEDVVDNLDEEKERMLLHNASRILDADLLYVLFTSGSTGVPKGVAICHRSVVDYIDWVTEEFHITEEDSFGNQAPFYFDNSILDIYSSVKTGASLYIIPVELFAQPVKLLTYLAEKQITTIFWVPSALLMVSRFKAFRYADISGTIKRVLFCGEVMPNKQLNIWRQYLPDAVYANLYGPTEITDACTYYIVDRSFADEEPLPIGGPMRNTEILVFDEQDRLIQEPGVPGELCVRGTSLAVGYYNNPEKTAAAFVQNPLQTAYAERIYRTGDIVKYNERHELIYLSRKDFQIKHLGHRIELGEIETAAASLEGLSLCCCLYDEKHSRIVLFVEGDFAKDWITDSLKKLIPDYMLPGKIICEEQLPLNANGKIDRVKLKEQYLN